MKKVLFVITEDWALLTHRRHLVIEAVEKGYKVGVATNFSKYNEEIKALGAETLNWNLSRGSLNPFSQMRSLMSLLFIIFSFKPDIVHAVAQKPVLYVGVLKKIFCFNFLFVGALGGLGYIFNSNQTKARVIKVILVHLLRMVFKGSKRVLILQNNDNISLFKNLNIVSDSQMVLIPGSGVELQHFLPSEIPKGTPKVIFAGRILWDKGVGEFVRLAKSITLKGIPADFIIYGEIDKHNSEAVAESQLKNWIFDGFVTHKPGSSDMVNVYKNSSIVCLPSYHEGLPKVLLEACASARPVVAFDVVGCREIVRDGVNGFLIPFKNQEALENAVELLINNADLCYSMGLKGRSIVEQKYGTELINLKTFTVWEQRWFE